MKLLSRCVAFLPGAAPDQRTETLPGAHGVAELFNFIVLLLQQLTSDLHWNNHQEGAVVMFVSL